MAAGTPFKSEQEVLSRSFHVGAEGIRQAPYSGPIKAQAVTVTTGSALIPATPLANRKAIMIKPAADIQIGEASGVTTATGFTITANTTLVLECDDTVVIYAIASGSVNVRVLEIS